MNNPSGSSAEVYLQGAHITSFKNSKGTELLFMSTKVIFQQGKAIRGGIPICWPQFGPGDLPQHGFARVSNWNIKETSYNDSVVVVTLTLSDSDETRKLWNHSFSLDYRISLLADVLRVELIVSNTNQDNRDFTFTGALHSYYKVEDARKSHVIGLKDVKYRDKVKSTDETESNEQITFTGETDRVYFNAPNEVKLVDQSNGTLSVKTNNYDDVVVWNPWIKKCKDTPDLGDDDWINMVCVEAGAIGKPITLSTGSKWNGRQEISKL